MRPVKLFLFDLDGTLVSTGGAGLRALDRAFRELYGIDGVMASVNPQGKTDPAIFREIIRTHLRRDMAAEEAGKIAACYLNHLAGDIAADPRVRVLAGVESFLETLSRRTDIVAGLGTGNLEPGARIKLAPTGLNEIFSFGGFGSDSEDRPEVLRHGHRRAQQRVGAPIPDSAVYVIGDTVLDVRAARAAGYRAVSVASGSVGADELSASGPDYLFPDLSVARQMLEELDPASERISA